MTDIEKKELEEHVDKLAAYLEAKNLNYRIFIPLPEVVDEENENIVTIKALDVAQLTRNDLFKEIFTVLISAEKEFGISPQQALLDLLSFFKKYEEEKNKA